MKELLVAGLLFFVGLILAIVATAKYAKEKKVKGDDIVMKPHMIRFGIVFLLFILAQIFIILSKH